MVEETDEAVARCGVSQVIILLLGRWRNEGGCERCVVKRSMEVKNLPLGESVIVTGPIIESDDTIVRAERVDEKDREEEDLVLELQLELVASEVNLALGTMLEVPEIGVPLCLSELWRIGKGRWLRP